MTFRLAALAALTGCLTLAGCGPKGAAPKSADSPPPPPTGEIWLQYSGERAMDEVRRQVAFGARPSGSAALGQARDHLEHTLRAAGWDVERQEFDAEPVLGKGTLHFVNLIARFSGARQQPAPATTQRAIIGSHYDTKRMFGINFVGANDGASSTGALLELARVLAKQPALAERVELVFFDGEEAVEAFSENAEAGPDGLVGSRHYASQLRHTGRARQFQFAMVWDMIGDKDLGLTLPSDTPRPLLDGLFQAGDALGLRKYIGLYQGPVLDDHVPIQVITHIPSIDLIDFDYAPWHTSGDTLDQLSPDSLQVIGRLTLWYLARELAK